jgi:hypothetical protein
MTKENWKNKSMSFELVRFGWPNTAAVLALAVLPMVSLMALPQTDAVARTADAATICSPAGAVTMATLLPASTAE